MAHNHSSAMSTFADIKTACLQENRLFEDTDFPARNTSINPHGDNPEDCLWRRPMEIADEPQFVMNGTTRFDLVHGQNGDCWFISACAVLATRNDLFWNVVPTEQNFQSDYAGIFRFNIWRYGEWREVYVDDRLPVTIDNTLRFARNRSQPNEFWVALLEKAYAKLEGSYSAIQYGHLRDALVDLTGGISEDFSLRRENSLPLSIFEFMKSSHDSNSIICSGIWADNGTMNEELMWNGLYKGHVYIITSVLERRIQGWHVQLLRLQNPWGAKEWTGAWSEGSEEWNALTEADRQEIGLTAMAEAGEFWMSFQDFLVNLHGLEIIHLNSNDCQPATEGAEASAASSNGCAIQWHQSEVHGEWIHGINAGGSGYLGDRNTRLYFTNPQYAFTLTDPDEGDISGECTCVVSLLQKERNRRKVQIGHKKLSLGFDLHQLKPSSKGPLQADCYFEKAKLKKQHQTPRFPGREISLRFQLDPGSYCVIPYTVRPHHDGQFLLRVFTYNQTQIRSLDDDVLVSEYRSMPSPTDKPLTTFSNDMFVAFAGDEFVLDARDLRDLLVELARKEFGETVSFGVESCRSLIAMRDTEGSGSLTYDEMLELWDEVVYWRKVFKKYDRDKSGCIETYELKGIFREFGFSLSLDTLACLVKRYGGKDKNLFFEDFTICLARTKTLFGLFSKYSAKTPGEARMTLDQWFSTTLYL